MNPRGELPHGVRRDGFTAARRRLGLDEVRGTGLFVLLALAVLWSCDESVAPKPPKQGNQPPDTVLFVQGDSLAPQLYRIRLNWLGSDPDGQVVAYRRRWKCEASAPVCLVDTSWSETQQRTEEFILPVPGGTATYVFEVSAVDDDGMADPEPARQHFELLNNPPVVAFEPGTLPQKTLPAVTFYLTAVDPDSTPNEKDHDGSANLDHYVAWLDGATGPPKIVSIEESAVTLRQEDFEGRYGMRTIFAQVVDNGAAYSDTIQHTWEVESAPENGILLVDDCRMGGNLARRSDASWRNVLTGDAPDRTRVLDIEALPRVSRSDLEATLALFDQTIWYTDADTTSSGALELVRESLLDLLDGGGKLVLCSGLVFGTRSALGDLEPQFLERFGIDTVFRGPDGSTNFALSLQDTVRADVNPGLPWFRMLSLGLRPIMECFRSVEDEATRYLYYYPEATFVRGSFTNSERFDIGVLHENAGGGRAAYVSFPIGLPINSNQGENETEIREILKLVGILP